MSLFPSTGGAAYSETSVKVIRLILKGCVNRPFYHISVMEKNTETYEQTIEQIGNYDPLPNKYNEKLFAINFNRLEYWLRNDVKLTTPVLKLLGLAGYFPVHPDTFEMAWKNRVKISNLLKELKIQAAEFTSEEALKSTFNASVESPSASTETVLASSAEPLSSPAESEPPESSSSTETVSTDPADSSSSIEKPTSKLSSDTSDLSKSPDDPSPHSEGKS